MLHSVKSIIYIAICVLAIIFFYCSIQSPEAPEFESQLNVPVTIKYYYMRELAEDEKNLYVDDKNNFGFLVEGELDTVRASEVLKYEEPIGDNGGFQIGLFRIAAPDTLRDSSLTIASLWPYANNLNGQNVSIEAFDFSVDKNQVKFEQSKEFRSVSIDTGHLSLGLTNKLAIPIGPPLTLLLWDMGLNSPIGEFSFSQTILPGETAFESIGLSGKNITNNLSFELVGRSAGSQGETVLIDLAQQKIIVHLAISQLRASRAEARIPALNIKSSDWLSLDETSNETIIHKAKLASCELNLVVTSNLPMDSKFTMIFQHIVDEFNEPYKISDLDIKAFKTKPVSTDLSGYYIVPELDANGLNPRLKVLAGGVTTSTGNEIVTLALDDLIEVNASLDSITMEYVEGVINRYQVDLDTITQEIDFDYELPNLNFRNTELQLDIVNQIAFPIELNMSFWGRRHSGKLVKYEFRRKIIDQAAWTQGSVETTEKTTSFTVNDEQFDKFISFLPEHLTISGNALIGGYQTTGLIAEDNLIYGTYTLRAPFTFSFRDTVINFDTTYIQIKPDNWDEQQDNLVDYTIESTLTEDITSCEFWAVVENSLPLQAEVIVRMDTSETQVFSAAPCAIHKSVLINSGVIDNRGNVEKAVVDTLAFGITPDEIQLFKNNTNQPKIIVVGLQLSLQGTNGRFVNVSPDNYFAITKSFLKFRVAIKQD